MRREDISDALNLLDNDIIEETNKIRMHNKRAEIRSMHTHKSSRRMSRILIIAAVIAVMLTISGFAVYTYWHMPDKGETYTGDNIQTHDVNSYPVPEQTENNTTDTTEPPDTEHSALSDEWFIDKAIYVLNTVNKLDIDASQLTVTRQTNQQWNREEVLVSFSDTENRTSDAKFEAESGCLIKVTAFDKEITGDTPMSDSDALAIAQNYYDILPYAKGYSFDYVEKVDDHGWMYHFDKPMQVILWGESQTIYSDYEQVRIVIDPCSGTFQLSNCFYVPLLDDHSSETEPIKQEEAITIVEAQQILTYDISNYTIDAKIGVCLPRPEEVSLYLGASEYTGEDYKYYNITRLGWILTIGSESVDVSTMQFCIDLYTGEILSIEMYND